MFCLTKNKYLFCVQALIITEKEGPEKYSTRVSTRHVHVRTCCFHARRCPFYVRTYHIYEGSLNIINELNKQFVNVSNLIEKVEFHE